ncbi:MAG: ABC transporter ATP-binding protein [Chitinophagaceae bacterium]|nr:MAG: ABC transporter ATP-binding protein [Chitinophagaceae bacterium]
MKNPYMSMLSASWKYARKERRRMILIYLMFLCANIIFSLNPLLLGWFVGKAQDDNSRILTYALSYAACYFFLKLAEWAFHGPARLMERALAFHLSKNFMQEKYHETLHLTAKWHQDNHSGATINRIKRAYDALRGFADGGFTYLHTLTKFIFSVTAIIIFSPLFGTIAVLIGFVTVFIIARFDKPFVRSLHEVNTKENQVTSNLFDSLSNIRTVITLRLERSMEKGLMHKLITVARPFRRNAAINEWKWFTAEMMITLIYCIIVVGYVHQHWVPGSTFYVAGLVTLLGYVNQFTSVFQNVASQYTSLVQQNTNMQGAQDISEAYRAHHRADLPIQLPRNWQRMEITNLNFSHRASYDDQFVPQSLHNLHLEFKRGSRIALIGASGSGKSTLMSLMRGLYIAGDGAVVTIDGETVPPHAIHESTTLFPQEPEIFENTIAYNVTLGLACSEEEIKRVCEIASFNEVIAQMPEGLQTDIREKGVNLSGGQKQRLALARGVLAAKDSDLILLDEPTSSVDPATEYKIYQRMFEAFSDKVVISSIHRLHLLENFDYIYLLDKGRIISQGSFHSLLANDEHFKNMWDSQQGPVVRRLAS